MVLLDVGLLACAVAVAVAGVPWWSIVAALIVAGAISSVYGTKAAEASGLRWPANAPGVRITLGFGAGIAAVAADSTGSSGGALVMVAFVVVAQIVARVAWGHLRVSAADSPVD